MKKLFGRTLSFLLTLSLLSALVVPAGASEALGQEMTGRDTLLNQQTQLSTNVFWSSAYSDLRTEHLITYTPNHRVTPIVTYGTALTSTTTVSAMARQLEGEGRRVVAGINGDFYNVNTGLPIGMVVTDGVLRSSDAGYYAVGFRADGSAVLGKPGVTITAQLGYSADPGDGMPVPVAQKVTAVNKARVDTGGIYLYTYDFNDRHTSGTAAAGINVLCTITEGQVSIGKTVTAKVEQVAETAAATAMGENQLVLSVNLQSAASQVEALRNIPVGAEITLEFTAADEQWNDVDYAVGALYQLVQDGAVTADLPAGANPRTAVGLKEDGTVVFYTIDGRKSGHSIGATMKQVAQRLVEMGCVTALGLDGGGSTTLSVTEPDDTAAQVVNRPSEGAERAVSNQIFLVADSEPSHQLSHFYVSADADYVLAGSAVTISAAAIDTNFIPMNRSYDLWASGGTLRGNVLTTPEEGGDLVITAEGGGRQGETTVHAIAQPDSVAICNASGAEVDVLHVTPGAVTKLLGTALYSRMQLKADPACFQWTVEGDIGTVDADGVFTAAAPGIGTITATAGDKSASVEVTVSRTPLKTVENFERESSIFSVTQPEEAAVSTIKTESLVRLGRGAGKIDYTLKENPATYALVTRINASADWNPMYTTMNLWIYGDSSGNTLSLVYNSSTEGEVVQEITKLNFTGWQQFTVDLWSARKLLGLEINGGTTTSYEDAQGNLVVQYPTDALTGTIYVDQMVAAFTGTVDTQPPAVTLAVDGDVLTGSVLDTVDGTLPLADVELTCNGAAMAFHYTEADGKLTAALPLPDGTAHRVTLTATDASGNIGRVSLDLDAYDVQQHFSDMKEHWGAVYVNYLYTAGVTGGFEDGTFRPNQNVTRAQFAAMLYRYLGLEESKYAEVELPFADASAIPAYAVLAVKALYTEGVINGNVAADGKLYFYPASSLTRAQAAAMIGRTQRKGYAAAELSFADQGEIPAYAVPYIQTMVAQGVLGGFEDGTFRPSRAITRGQMAKILFNLM